MAFEHHPGLAALHQVIAGGAAAATPKPAIEREVEEAVELKVELEAIAKDIADDQKVNRPAWKGGFGS